MSAEEEAKRNILKPIDVDYGDQDLKLLDDEDESPEANGMTPIEPVSEAAAFEYLANHFHHLYESLMVQLNDHSYDYDDFFSEFNGSESASIEKRR